MQSRNFKLQRVGDFEWLSNNYGFSNVSKYIDELIVLNCGGDDDSISFVDNLSRLSRECFIPITAGGGIRSLEYARTLIQNGADKVLLNTALHEDKKLVKEVAATFGRQSIIAAVDFKFSNEGLHAYVENGTKLVELCFKAYLRDVLAQPIGELYLNSINRDGTGQGFFMEVLDDIPSSNTTPVIIAGGAGNQYHLNTGLSSHGVDAVATANLFNFVGSGLQSARQSLLEDGLNLVAWPDESLILDC